MIRGLGLRQKEKGSKHSRQGLQRGKGEIREISFKRVYEWGNDFTGGPKHARDGKRRDIKKGSETGRRRRVGEAGGGK